MLHARHTVGFLHLAAAELRQIAKEPYVQADPDELAARLQMIAGKFLAEADDLEAALAPKEEKDETRR